MRPASPEEKNKTLAILASALFLLAFAILAYVFFQHISFQPFGNKRIEGLEEYCQMVRLYMETNGREGWPDYRNLFYRECVRR